MVDLTDDEVTVLDIASRGEPMMPIGRWEVPVEHLIVLGLLKRRNDKFNNVITDAGRKALAESGGAQEAIDDALAKALINKHDAGVRYRQAGEEIAQNFYKLVSHAVVVTGDHWNVAISKCLEALRDRVNAIYDDEH